MTRLAQTSSEQDSERGLAVDLDVLEVVGVAVESVLQRGGLGEPGVDRHVGPGEPRKMEQRAGDEGEAEARLRTVGPEAVTDAEMTDERRGVALVLESKAGGVLGIRRDLVVGEAHAEIADQ